MSATTILVKAEAELASIRHSTSEKTKSSRVFLIVPPIIERS